MQPIDLVAALSLALESLTSTNFFPFKVFFGLISRPVDMRTNLALVCSAVLCAPGAGGSSPVETNKRCQKVGCLKLASFVLL